jgi:NAD(P)-dependent dehydrogenase (short-subunit alcohol dehydrogenase family)
MVLASGARARRPILRLCVRFEPVNWNRTLNAVLPGIIDTPRNRASATPEAIARWTKPDAIARVIRWLCSDEAAIISGAAIPVYGQS